MRQTSRNELSQLVRGEFKAYSEALPDTIQGALGFPTISTLVRQTSKEVVQLALEYELVKVSALVSVGGNLTKAQIPFIASQFMINFPNETVADFKLILTRGATGLYGEIQRLDGVTVGVWTEAYLEDKYKAIEDKLMREKDNNDYYIHPPSNAVIPLEEADKYLQEWLKSVDKIKAKTIVPLSDDDMKKEGSERSKKKTTSYISEYRDSDEKHHRAWYTEMYPKATQHEVDTWIASLKKLKL